MRKQWVVWLVALVLALGVGISSAQDQSSEIKKTNLPVRKVEPYRLDFSLVELQDGKKLNTRQYSMALNTGSHHTINIGTRVPVATGAFQTAGGAPVNPLVNTQWQYLDVGTRIVADLHEGESGLELSIMSSVSGIDPPPSLHGQPTGTNPVIRNIELDGSTIVIPGTPTVIASVDDPNSNRQFELEVTATKLR